MTAFSGRVPKRQSIVIRDDEGLPGLEGTIGSASQARGSLYRVECALALEGLVAAPIVSAPKATSMSLEDGWHCVAGISAARRRRGRRVARVCASWLLTPRKEKRAN